MYWPTRMAFMNVPSRMNSGLPRNMKPIVALMGSNVQSKAVLMSPHRHPERREKHGRGLASLLLAEAIMNVLGSMSA